MRPPRRLWRFFSEDRQHKWTMESFRENMLWFGHDLSGLTDGELMDSAVKGAAVLGKLGFTVKEAVEGFRNLGEAARNARENMEGLHERSMDRREDPERGGSNEAEQETDRPSDLEA